MPISLRHNYGCSSSYNNNHTNVRAIMCRDGSGVGSEWIPAGFRVGRGGWVWVYVFPHVYVRSRSQNGMGQGGFYSAPLGVIGAQKCRETTIKIDKKWHTTLAHDFARLIFLFGPLKPSGSWVLQWVYLIFVSGFDSHRLRGYILTQYGV